MASKADITLHGMPEFSLSVTEIGEVRKGKE
jgi:hypothetical protein